MGTAARLELAELHDWTLELTRLRSWQADAEKVIVQQARDLQSLQRQKVSANQEPDDGVALRGQLSTAQEEVEGVWEDLEVCTLPRHLLSPGPAPPVPPSWRCGS